MNGSERRACGVASQGHAASGVRPLVSPYHPVAIMRMLILVARDVAPLADVHYEQGQKRGSYEVEESIYLMFDGKSPRYADTDMFYTGR